MSRPDAASPDPQKDPETDPLLESTAEAVDVEPEPEPWTPERVSEWNAYYDWYVMGAVLLLAFVVSASRTNYSPLWANLKQGQDIIRQSSPAPADEFSYTEEGSRWVNIPWLFQVGGAAIYKLAFDMVPVDPVDPTANRASAEQIAVGTLVALTALARLATALVLLRIRRKGPGLWWTAVCTAVALGATLGPTGVLLGGVAQPAIVGPSTFGLLLLAIEMLLLFRAFGEGRGWALYALVPLFLLWANVDDSFLLGLLILGAAAVGRVLDGRAAAALIEPPARVEPAEGDGPTRRSPVSPAAGFVALALCAAACLANPSTYKIYGAAIAPVLRLFEKGGPPPTSDQLSYFGETIRTQYPNGWYMLTLFFLLTVAAGMATFLLNAARFSWSRFLPFAVAAAAWGVYMRLSAEFAVVLAASAAINGQEWYQSRFGVRGKLGNAWAAWSTGGRLLTLGALFYLVSTVITGYGKTPGEPRFGFGFDPNDFAFEAAEFLASRDDVTGNVFNWTLGQGDALMWKAGPLRKTFADNRRALFPPAVMEEHHLLMNALRDDDPEVWKPAFDKYNITAVMIDPASATNTYRKLSQSPNWIPFYDDGRVVMFGRSDAPDPDLAAFKANRLEPDLRAYKVSSPALAADRPPTPVNWIDDIFQSRALTAPQARIDAARRWLAGPSTSADEATMPDPARCLLAIREARTALARNPDDTAAYRILAVSYNMLMRHESAMLAGIPITPENQDQITSLPPRTDLLGARMRQRITALNYAIQTTPPPKDDLARRELMAVQFELAEAYLTQGFVDLAQERLQLALGQAKPGDLTDEGRLHYTQQLDQLTERVAQIKDAISELQIERQAGPIEKGMFALNQGAPGLAIVELEEADRSSMSPAIVKPQLVDLYCATGQPDRALEQLTSGVAEDPNLGEPGTSTFRQGQVYLLLGNYLSTASLWQDRAIPRLRLDRSAKALFVGQRMMRGDLLGATNDTMAVPGLIRRQASWAFELAQCLLESGEPARAAEHFTNCLTLTPDLVVRPIVAYYLEKMGKPIPPTTQEKEAQAASPAEKPEASSPDKTADEAPKEPAPAPEPEAPKEAPKPEAEPEKKP
jgi:Tfp pilus assembly protein PilF